MGVLFLVFILIIAPLSVGSLICGRSKGKYLHGFISVVGIFFVCYIGYVTVSCLGIVADRWAYRLSVLGWIFVAVTVVLTAISLSVLFRKGGIRLSLPKMQPDPLWVIAILWIVFQIIRVVTMQTVEYRDDRTYIAMMGDYIYNDSIFGADTDSGEPVRDISGMNVKWLISPWYHFLAVISDFAGLHPAIIYKTILPVPLMLLTYMALYELGQELGLRGRSLHGYMLISAAAFEALAGTFDPATGFLVWPMWGKNPAGLVVVPMILSSFLRGIRYGNPGGSLAEEKDKHNPKRDCDKGSCRREVLKLICAGVAGCGMSATCMMVIPIEMAALFVAYAVCRCLKGGRPLRRFGVAVGLAAAGLLPPVIDMVIFIMASRGVLI
ncbi:MAG: hypothetical protein J6N76_02910 [Lachnospiraceae bacterium]|nr:hypothetical protein [Lachnospiraceae bacterium]